MMEDIKLGIEVEMNYNNSLIHISKYSYHGGREKELPGWKFERDGSLNETKFRDSVEAISTLTTNIKDFKKRIEDFIKFFSKNGEKELNEVICFNDSCGCHIHFSYGERMIRGILFKEYDKLLYEYFCKLLNKSKINDYAKKNIIKRYYRHYARKVDKEVLNCRYLGLNYSSEVSGRGMEWRNFNLTGIQTWKEFKEIINIALKCLNYLYSCLKIKPKKFKEKKDGLFIPKKNKKMKVDNFKFKRNAIIKEKLKLNNKIKMSEVINNNVGIKKVITETNKITLKK